MRILMVKVIGIGQDRLVSFPRENLDDLLNLTWKT